MQRASLLMILCVMTACHTPSPRPAKVTKPAPSCDRITLRSLLTLNYLKQGAMELSASSPCTSATFALGPYTVTTDASGRIILPTKITLKHLRAPSPITAPFDAAIASRLLTGGYYSHGYRRFLAVLSFSEAKLPQFQTIRDHFCSQWKKLSQKGATWSRLLASLGGFVRREEHGWRFFNMGHGYSLPLRREPVVIVKPVPSSTPGSLSLVSLSFTHPKSELVLFSSTTHSVEELKKIMKLDQVPLTASPSGVFSGRLGTRSIHVTSLKKSGLTLLAVHIAAPRAAQKALSRMKEEISLLSFRNPCPEAGPR